MEDAALASLNLPPDLLRAENTCSSLYYEFNTISLKIEVTKLLFIIVAKRASYSIEMHVGGCTSIFLRESVD